MGAINQQAMAAWLRYRAHWLGWQGMLGGTLLLASLVAALAWWLPGEARLEQREQELAKLRQAMPQHQGKFVDRSPQASLNTFYRFLPAESEATSLLTVILSLAGEHGLTPDKADYALVRSPSAAFSRYQITLPVRGSYVEIRRFANQVLNRIPSAALNDISMKRQDINTEQVEARLRFTVFLHREQP